MYQVPESMRSAFETGMHQAKTIFDEMMAATQRAMSTFEGSAKTMQSSALEVNRRIMGIAETNVTAALEHAEKLVRARDVQEMLAAHQDFVRRQVERMSEQTRELSELARSTSNQMGEQAAGAAKTMGPGGGATGPT